jgi:hypothetical protein
MIDGGGPFKSLNRSATCTSAQVCPLGVLNRLATIGLRSGDIELAPVVALILLATLRREGNRFLGVS